jgi:hypothetical protein
MKRIMTAVILGIPVLVAGALVLGQPRVVRMTPTVWADEGAPCSLGSAAGNWSFTDNGTIVSPPLGLRAAVGKFTLDAEGNLVNGVTTSSLNGGVASETFYGTYTVNHDCTGTIDVKIFSSSVELFEVTLFTAFDNNMSELRGLFTSVTTPGGASLTSVVSLQARKQ